MSSVKCFFSGIEGDQHFNACVNAGVTHVLTSYLYLRKKGDFDIVKRRKRKHPNIHFMVDSGAHTFIEDYGQFQSWSKQQFEDYVIEYTNWLRANREYIFCGVEFDIDYTLNMIFGGGPNSTVGPSMVERWQEKYFMPLQEKGVDICYVWHTERKLEGWELMCSKFSYVGLPGELSSTPDFNKFITVARRYNTKIHGFAATKQSDFRDHQWYSVDSITWKTCEMYGTLIHWDAHKQLLIYDQDKSNRRTYYDTFVKLGLDADGIVNDTNYKEVTKYALHSMRAMEKFYEQVYKDRLMYYDYRLPHPKRILTCAGSVILRLWKEMRPTELFKQHFGETDPTKIRIFLVALACVQYKDHSLLRATAGALKFLEAYFPKLVSPQLADEVVFQKELAQYTAPPNRAALPRVAPEHFVPTNNPPKLREASRELTLSELEWSPEEAISRGFELDV